jgi:hypothetical protein
VYLCVSILVKAIPCLISLKFVHTASNKREVVERPYQREKSVHRGEQVVRRDKELPRAIVISK